MSDQALRKRVMTDLGCLALNIGDCDHAILADRVTRTILDEVLLRLLNHDVIDRVDHDRVEEVIGELRP